jgi:uncharacterized membrane protein
MRLKLLFLSIFLLFPLSPILAESEIVETSDNLLPESQIFKVRVEKVLEEQIEIKEDGFKSIKQNLLLKVTSGEAKNKEFTYTGISEFDVVAGNQYQEGDKLIIQQVTYPDQSENIIIVDYNRENYLYLLLLLFIIIAIIVGRKKGLRSLLGLIASFLIIVKFILPQILNGANPLIIALLGSSLILILIIYINEGFNKKSHISILSVFITLSITLFLAVVFSTLTKLTGLSNEEALFLVGKTKQAIDFKGLMLAGFLIGAVGVLDDVIVGQVESVKQLISANPDFTKKELFKSAYAIGNTHLGAIINTLFLTYTGASLPLLLLFTIKQEPFLTFSQTINNEIIAIEIVRTLIGSIGVALSLPITTFLAIYFLHTLKKK